MRILFASLAVAMIGGVAFAQPLPDQDLDRIHAGFIDPAGQQFAIGAVMKSYVDGTLELTSTLSMSAAGIVTSQQLGADAVPLDATSMAGYGGGAMVPGAGGTTTFVHNFTNDQLTNMVVNSANNRAITQDTNVTVTVPNLPALQQSMALQSLGSRLQSAMGMQQLQATGH